MKKESNSKIRNFLNEYPAIKTYGTLGIIILFLSFVFSTIFSNEVSRIWNDLIHPDAPAIAIANSEGIILTDVFEFTPGLYNNDKISFMYPEDWIPSEGNDGIISVQGYQMYEDKFIEYIFSVLDITNDLSKDIEEYVYGKMTEEPLPGAIGSISFQPLGNYSGVWTGYLYYDGNSFNFYDDEDADKKIRSVSIMMLTDGKTRIYAELRTPNLTQDESYDNQILEDILNSFVIK